MGVEGGTPVGWPPRSGGSVAVDCFEGEPLEVGGPEVCAIPAEDQAPLLSGFVDARCHEVRDVGVPAPGHGDIRGGGAGGLADGDVGVVDGLTLRAVDGRRVGQLHVLAHVRRGQPVVAALFGGVNDQVADCADPA